MGLKYYSKQVNNVDKFLPLPSKTDRLLYANTSPTYHESSSNSAPMSMIKSTTDSYMYDAIRNYGILKHSKRMHNDLQNRSCKNISKPILSRTNVSNEATYKALIYATSMTSTSDPKNEINREILNKNKNSLVYGNINLCSSLLSSVSPYRFNELLSDRNVSTNDINLSSHVYMNLQHCNEIASTISVDAPTLQEHNSKEELPRRSIYPTGKNQVDIETNVVRASSNTNTIQTSKKLEVNMVPNCGDKSILYRRKIPTIITPNLPSSRRRQALNCSQQHHRYNSISSRNSSNSNLMRRQQKQQQQHYNVKVHAHHLRINHDQRKRSLPKYRLMKSASNPLYDEFSQSVLQDDELLNHIDMEEEEEEDEDEEKAGRGGERIGIVEYPIKFHRVLQNKGFECYPNKISNKKRLIPRVCSISDNEKSNEKDAISTNVDELYPHDIFEDFLLRRRPTRLSNSTLLSSNNTTISEAISHETPFRSSPLTPRCPGMTLSLDKNDVDFIHDIIARTYGNQRVSNRIAALREAYIRATSKRNNLMKTEYDKTRTTMKHSLTASKIRHELEKYHELPIHRKTLFYDNDTLSIYDHRQYHLCTIPVLFATVHRIISCITSIKRQLQKNFQNIRSRILIEAMAIQSNHVAQRRQAFRNSSSLTDRHRSRPKPMYNIVRHPINDYHIRKHSHPIRPSQIYRTDSNRTQLKSPQQFSLVERHLSHRPQTYRNISRQKQRHRID